MERVLVVVQSFEDFAVGDMIIAGRCDEVPLDEEHRHKAVAIALQSPADDDIEEN